MQVLTRGAGAWSEEWAAALEYAAPNESYPDREYLHPPARVYPSQAAETVLLARLIYRGNPAGSGTANDAGMPFLGLCPPERLTSWSIRENKIQDRGGDIYIVNGSAAVSTGVAPGEAELWYKVRLYRSGSYWYTEGKLWRVGDAEPAAYSAVYHDSRALGAFDGWAPGLGRVRHNVYPTDPVTWISFEVWSGLEYLAWEPGGGLVRTIGKGGR